MSQQELTAVKELLSMLILEPRLAVLTLILVGAAVCDYRTRRIPNVIVGFGALFGLYLNIVYPPAGQSPIFFSLSGLVLGMALLLPVYLLKAMGAGDVKLLGMVGAFLGPLATFHAALGTFVVGGVLSILFVLRRGTALRMFDNVNTFVRDGYLGVMSGSPHVPRFSLELSAGRLPYGIAIAMGTIGYLVLNQLGLA